VKVARALFVLAIVTYLGHRLILVGWEDLYASMPTQPAFYVLFAALYLLLPLSQLINYRLTWQFDARRSFSAFLLKRVYNRDLLDYSGELYFYTWARRNVDLPDRELLKTIRDQNILSVLAASTMAIGLLVVFVYLGHVSLAELIEERASPALIGAAGAALALIMILSPLILRLRWREYLFSMPARTALSVFAVHSLRLVVGQVLQIAQWMVGVPGVPLGTWCTYAAASIIVSRLPLFPSRDLIFLGVGISLSDALGVPAAGVASMLLVNAVLTRIINLGLFVLLTSTANRRGEKEPEKQAGAGQVTLSGPRDPEAD
jgi:hypothetical protein